MRGRDGVELRLKSRRRWRSRRAGGKQSHRNEVRYRDSSEGLPHTDSAVTGDGGTANSLPPAWQNVKAGRRVSSEAYSGTTVAVQRSEVSAGSSSFHAESDGWVSWHGVPAALLGIVTAAAAAPDTRLALCCAAKGSEAGSVARTINTGGSAEAERAVE